MNKTKQTLLNLQREIMRIHRMDLQFHECHNVDIEASFDMVICALTMPDKNKQCDKCSNLLSCTELTR
jgi:hypothetical protein